MSAWTSDEDGDVTRCGHCDNCTRATDEIELRDITIDAWRILRVVQVVEREGGRVTVGQLVDLARGVGLGTFNVTGQTSRKRRKSQFNEKLPIDLGSVSGDKLTLNRQVGASMSQDDKKS
jgi:ATP-dependent DNA helicase Q1